MKARWFNVSLCLIGLLVTSFVAMCFINPSTAHNDNSTEWNGLLAYKETTEVENISSNLLVKGGQNILISSYNKEYRIPITIISNKDIKGAAITVVSENNEKLSATISEESVDFKAGQEQSIELNMAVVQNLDDVTSAVSEILSAENGSVDGIETNETDDNVVTVTVSLTCGEETVSATFLIPVTEKTEEITASGALEKIQTQYNRQLPITIVSGTETTVLQLNEGNFPAFTKYSVNGTTNVLYDGGVIELDGNTTAEIDLSETEVSGEININTTQQSYILKEVNTVVLNNDSQPFIIKDILELPVNYLWGQLEPVIKTEQLTVADNQMSWTETNSVTYEKSSSGNIQLKNNNAEAGTYMLTVLWIENEVILYQLEIPFFVRYDSAALGGTGQ